MYPRGEDSKKLESFVGDKATLAGEIAAFGWLSRGYNRNREGVNQEFVQVLNRSIDGCESSELDTPSEPGLIVAWVYTSYHTCNRGRHDVHPAYWELTAACIHARVLP